MHVKYFNVTTHVIGRICYPFLLSTTGMERTVCCVIQQTAALLQLSNTSHLFATQDISLLTLDNITKAFYFPIYCLKISHDAQSFFQW